MDDALYQLAEETGLALKAKGWMLATAESCTGGWMGEAVTAVAGSSSWYDRGFITYTNAAKQEMLGVSAETLASNGAVSEATVREMASGVLLRSHAHISVAISGIAGPTGGSPDKPVGTVCFAWGIRGGAVDGHGKCVSPDGEIRHVHFPHPCPLPLPERSRRPGEGDEGSLRECWVKSESRLFPGDRHEVRRQAVQHALRGVLALVQL